MSDMRLSRGACIPKKMGSWNIEQQCEQWHFDTLEWGSNNSLFPE
jgi:hypothetical protein